MNDRNIPSNLQTESQRQFALWSERAKTPEHREFQRLLDRYLEITRKASFAGAHSQTDWSYEIVSAREALYEWARPAVETSPDTGEGNG